LVDGASEKKLATAALGTTGRGIGPTYSQKAERSGLRVHNLFAADFPEKFRAAYAGWEARYGDLDVTLVENNEQKTVKYSETIEKEIQSYIDKREMLKPMVIDGAEYFDDTLKAGKKLLIESANAVMLDIDHGTYPYVTSSNPTVGGASVGLGVPVNKLGNALVAGIVKAYTTRVGAGPFPTELDINAEKTPGWIFQTVGREVGTTTGRKRRCGWLDLPIVKYGHRLNGYTAINITKLDVLDTLAEIKVCTRYTLDGKILSTCPADLADVARVECHYTTFPGWQQSIENCKTWDDLPENARKYLDFIEVELGVPIRWVGVGPSAAAMIEK